MTGSIIHKQKDMSIVALQLAIYLRQNCCHDLCIHPSFTIGEIGAVVWPAWRL